MKALTDAGYKCWNTNKDQYGTTAEWQSRVDIRDGFDESIPLCQCNDKLFINVRLDDFEANGSMFHSASVSLTHENKEGLWCDFKICSLTQDELADKLPSLEQKLLRLWKEFNKE